MEVASKKARTISAEVMKSIATFLPMDGFKLSSDMLDQEYTVVRVIPAEFNGKPTFTVVLQNEDRVINLSAGMLKKARVLSTETPGKVKDFNGHANIVLRGDAEAIWNNSRYFHSLEGNAMKKDDSFIVPERIFITHAVLREDSTKPGTGALNPFLYEGFRKVVDVYTKGDKFPTMDDFRAELKKTGVDRIDGLPVETTEKPFAYVKENDPATMGFTLIFKDTFGEKE